MQFASAAFIALTALAVLMTPVFAKNTKVQKPETGEDASPTCSSYQLGPDGNWAPLPCQELGPHSSQQHRTQPKDHREEAH
jgi:hypothetical protein